MSWFKQARLWLGKISGRKIYCRNCTGEFEIKEGGRCLVATPTGHQGRPA